MNDATGPQILIDDRYILPCGEHVRIAAEARVLCQDYFTILRLLLLAGFCLLLTCSPSSGDDIFKPTGRYAVAQATETVTVKTKTRTRYLVSAPWCGLCPAAKSRFRSRGFPESNIITIAEALARFGKVVSYVPFEFEAEADAPQSSPQIPTRTSAESAAEKHLKDTHGIECSGLSMAEMETIHDNAHGGPQYHFPALSQPVYRCAPQTIQYRQRTRRRR